MEESNPIHSGGGVIEEKFRSVSLHRRIDSNNRRKPIASIRYIYIDESELVCERVMVFYCSITSNNVWRIRPWFHVVYWNAIIYYHAVCMTLK